MCRITFDRIRREWRCDLHDEANAVLISPEGRKSDLINFLAKLGYHVAKEKTDVPIPPVPPRKVSG